MTQENELAKDVKIDRDDLHTEWARQSDLYVKWAQYHIQAIYQQDKLKLELDILYGKLDAKIRKNWSALGFDKAPTEAAVAGWVKTNPEYVEKQSQVATNAYYINMFNAARQALEHKRRALEDLVKLHLAGYYGQLPTCKDHKEADIANMREYTGKRLAETLNNRKG